MSNNIDTTIDAGTEAYTADLRAEAPVSVKHSVAKAPIIVDEPNRPLTAADIVKLSAEIKASVQKQIAEAKYDPTMSAQILPKRVAPITDFSTVTLDQVYDLSFPIVAKPFMSADGLGIKLKDNNYEPRWVNKNPQRLGQMLGRGYTYICAEDLCDNEGKKAIQASVDAEGHFSINDVVAMKIDKATYYAALRFSHERAVGLTNPTELHKRAVYGADRYMADSDSRGDYQGAKAQRKIAFYSPDVTI